MGHLIRNDVSLFSEAVTFDQVNHVAKTKIHGKLDLKICKNLGIGNSTGLGMAHL